MDPLQYNASLLGTTRQRISFNTMPHYRGAEGRGTYSVLRHTTVEQWAVDLLLLTATLPGSSGQWMVAPKRSGITGRRGCKVSHSAGGRNFHGI